MPLKVPTTPIKFPEPDFLILQNFRRGVITLINESRLPKNALKEAKNLFLSEDGQPTTRPGTNWFGTPMPNGAAIDGFEYYDSNGVSHIVAVAGGIIYRSTTDGASWDLCTGATLTPGTWTNMNQNQGYLYLTDGVDNIIRYNGSTTLQTYTVLTTPAAPTIVTTPASPGTGYTYYYKISAVNQVGFSIASAATSVVHGVPRSGWSATTNFVTLTVPAFQTTQTRYDIFLSEDNVNFYYLDSIDNPNLTYKDDGSAIVVPSTTAPIDNTTQGPAIEELVNVGVRQFGVRDHNHRNRFWWTGSGSSSGAFSDAYDGGYLDWQLGGKYYPVKAADYRSGKGDPAATIWCDSDDGLGCIIQCTLGTETVGEVTVTVPSAYLLPGSRGTPAPNSVVNVLNDYYFYNSQAIYSIGSQAQQFNILSTDEVSANVRPNVRAINRGGEKNIAAEYFTPNIYISVPIHGTTNDTTMVFNTEMKAWLPEAFTIGFKKFLRYADANRAQHLLALKPGDTQLSEISDSFNGDYGVAFNTSLTTGLYKATSDIFDFQFTDEAEFEVAQPQGNIYVELLGIQRTQGFGSIKTVLLETTSSVVSGTGWDTYAWDTKTWDYTATVPSVISESSEKRYFTVMKELNAIQWHIYTTDLNSRYTHRTFQTWGSPTNAGHPSSWRLNGL